MTRDHLIEAFLARNGASLADTEPLAQDASFRRYLRLRHPRPMVLMDAPPPEDVGPFLRIARHLRHHGLAVPTIIDADEANGLILEEDFGDDLLSTLLDQGAPAEPILNAAVDALAAWQRIPPVPDLPAWDTEPMIATGIGIIDFQGAAIGHPAYDLMSLLQDARRDILARAASQAIARYLAQRPDLDPDAFHAAYQACAAQRHLRVSGQWVRLALRDARPQYLAHGPRTWRLLQDALQHPATAPLAQALDRWIPVADRRNPPERAT
jgi:aminoglycoside/choline kinase family phosphotransferase